MTTDQRGYRHPFLVGTLFFGGIGDNPRTLSELAMCQLSAEIRKKEKWWHQFLDPDTREEWSREAQQRCRQIRTPSAVVGIQLSKRQVEYVLEELTGYARLRDEQNHCQVSCFERIWEADPLMDGTSLNEVFRGLRNAQNPRDVVQTLIDPLLYCLVYGRTTVLDPNNHGSSSAEPSPHALSGQKFSLLPSDFSFSTSGSVKFLSYVNNLHPRHRSFYHIIETTLSAFMPLFEHVLTDLHRNNPLVQRIKGTCRYSIWEEPDPPEHSDDEDERATYEQEMQHWIMNRPLCLPDIPDGGYPGGFESRNHTVSLRGRNLQVVVDAYEVRLQPGGPEYSGSPWHIEGMPNERIVACAFYYSSVENLVDNSVEFRMAVSCPRGFFAGDTGATLRTWGLGQGHPCHQYIGSVPTRMGLGLVFPNIYQHRHTPFRLEDPSKEGHLSVLSFLLIDPEIPPVTSTIVVAPQQREWIRTAVDESLGLRIPIELIDKIMTGVEGLMTESEAKGFRREIHEERTRFWGLNDKLHFCVPFDVWNVPQLPP